MLQAPFEWQIAYASEIGKSHIDGNLPNQDAICLLQSSDSEFFSLVVSDGAGSAKRAQEGSQHFSRFIAEKLLALVQAVHDKRLSGSSRNQIGDHILKIIVLARNEIDPTGLHLRDFACNLMAVAMGPHWGIRVHLGDAVLLKSSFQLLENEKVDYFVGAQMTAQERSEYANETHFITEHDWTKHLIWDYLDPNGSDDLFALMSDGAADIALSNVPNSMERKVFRGFFVPLITQVLRAPQTERNQVIKRALANPQTYRLTGDDKTLALIMRKRCWSLAGYEPFTGDPGSNKDNLADAPDSNGTSFNLTDVAPEKSNQNPPKSSVQIPVATFSQLPLVAANARPASQSGNVSNGAIALPTPIASSSSSTKPRQNKSTKLPLIVAVALGLAIGMLVLPVWSKFQSSTAALSSTTAPQKSSTEHKSSKKSPLEQPSSAEHDSMNSPNSINIKQDEPFITTVSQDKSTENSQMIVATQAPVTDKLDQKTSSNAVDAVGPIITTIPSSSKKK